MIKKIKKYFMDLKIMHKILFCFLFVIFFLVVSIGTVSYKIASNILMEKIVEQSEETIQQISDNFDYNLKIIDEKLSYLAFSPNVQEELINSNATDQQDMNDYYSNYRAISRLMVQTYSSFSMQDIEIYGKNGKNYYISITSEKNRIENIEDLLFIAKINKGRNVIVNDTKSSSSLQIVKQIKDLLTMKDLGVLRGSIRVSYIESLIDNVDFASAGSIILLDENNEIIIGNESIKFNDADNLFSDWKDSFYYDINGNTYIVIYNISSYTGWKTIGIIPLEFLKNELFLLRISTFIISIIFLAIFIILARKLAGLIVSPINDMTKALHKFSQGDFTVHLYEERGDELGQMSKTFNRTIIQVEGLIQEVSRGRILEKELEFKTLQAQINPHFLYNTLDTINWMARNEGKEDICKLVTAVSKLMRISISNKQSIISLESEVGYIKDYLYIQKVRYGDRFESFFQFEEDVLKQMIPKLTLQPLVENAIIHGIEVSQNKCSICISGIRIQSLIKITIEDTGVGISKDKLQNILKRQDDFDMSNIDMTHTNLGIYAVNQRIKFMYGDAYGLEITSEEGKWTRIEIEIPYLGESLN